MSPFEWLSALCSSVVSSVMDADEQPIQWSPERIAFARWAVAALVADAIIRVFAAWRGSLYLSIAHAKAHMATLTKTAVCAHVCLNALWLTGWYCLGLAMCDEGALTPVRWDRGIIAALFELIPWIVFTGLSYWLYERMGQEVDRWAAGEGAMLGRVQVWLRRAGWTLAYSFIAVSFGRACSVVVWWVHRGLADVDITAARSLAASWALCAYALDYGLLSAQFEFVGPRASVRACVLSIGCSCWLLFVYLRLFVCELLSEGSAATVRAMHFACYTDIVLVALCMVACAGWHLQPGLTEAQRQRGFGLHVAVWIVYVALQIAGLGFVFEYQSRLTNESVHTDEMADLRMWADLLLAAAGTASLCVHSNGHSVAHAPQGPQHVGGAVHPLNQPIGLQQQAQGQGQAQAPAQDPNPPPAPGYAPLPGTEAEAAAAAAAAAAAVAAANQV